VFAEFRSIGPVFCKGQRVGSPELGLRGRMGVSGHPDLQMREIGGTGLCWFVREPIRGFLHFAPLRSK